MTDKNKLVEFLDNIEKVRLNPEYSCLSAEIYIAEIRGALVDYYDLIERLRNINFPVEKKREK